MNMPGGGEWFIILIIVILLFGAKKLPELAGSVGKSIREFKKAANETDTETSETVDEDR
jgi:sec-independent protein translocase protein TatA